MSRVRAAENPRPVAAPDRERGRPGFFPPGRTSRSPAEPAIRTSPLPPRADTPSSRWCHPFPPAEPHLRPSGLVVRTALTQHTHTPGSVHDGAKWRKAGAAAESVVRAAVACNLSQSRRRPGSRAREGTVEAAVGRTEPRPRRHTLTVWLSGGERRQIPVPGRAGNLFLTATTSPPPPARLDYSSGPGLLDWNWRVRRPGGETRPDGTPFPFSIPFGENPDQGGAVPLRDSHEYAEYERQRRPSAGRRGTGSPGGSIHRDRVRPQ